MNLLLVPRFSQAENHSQHAIQIQENFESSRAFDGRFESVLSSMSTMKERLLKLRHGKEKGTSENRSTTPSGNVAQRPGVISSQNTPATHAAHIIESSDSISITERRPDDPSIPPLGNDPEQPPEGTLPIRVNPVIESNTPLWDEAVSKFVKECKNDYDDFVRSFGEVEDDDPELSKLAVQFERAILNHELPKIFEAKATNPQHALTRRLKSWLPSLGAAKGLAVALSHLDPHHLAPYLVAASFFAVEIVLQTIPAEQKEATLDIICDSVIILLKWRSYEENVSQSHRAISDESAKNFVQRLRDQIPNLYLSGLKLQARIRKATRSRKKFSGAALPGTLEGWKNDLGVLKRHDRDCTALRDRVKDALERQENNLKVLKFLKKDGAPDPSQRNIKFKTNMNKDTYQAAGDWFLELDCFKDWMTQETETPAKRVIWLKGAMGTGKTTLMCQAISRFSKEQERRPPGNLKVAYYYCDSSATEQAASDPNKEIVIRSLCRKLAWLPSDTIASCARQFHSDFSPEYREPPNPSDWEELFNSLIQSASDRVLLIIDALDECSEPETLLKCLSECMQSRSNLYILCSSRYHVPVKTYFGDTVYEIDVLSGQKSIDMDIFINTVIQERKRSPETAESIFFDPRKSALLKRLREALSEGARGMFRWVEIWLSILFPPREQAQIIETDDANSLISQIAESKSIFDADGHKKLVIAYQRLWKVNSDVRYKELQPRLFQLILCSFERLTLEALTEALRIDPEGKKPYRNELSSNHVQWLCHNFLVVSSDRCLGWTHESAKEFILQNRMEDTTIVLSNESNNIYMAQIALQMMSSIDHPAWKAAGHDLRRWQRYNESTEKFQKLTLEREIMIENVRCWYQTKRVAVKRSQTIGLERASDLRLQTKVVESLQSTEHMSALIPLLDSPTFANYVVTHFIHHLRIAFNTAHVASNLGESLHSMITFQESSAFPAVATMFESYAALLHDLRGLYPKMMFSSRGSVFGYRFPWNLARPLPFATVSESSRGILKDICTYDDEEERSKIDPFRLLIVIDAPCQDLIQRAVKLSSSRSDAGEWDIYAGKLLCLACRYDSSKIASFLLERASLPGVTPSCYALLRARDESGRAAIHNATQYSHLQVIDALLRAEEHNRKNLSQEGGGANSDSKIFDNEYTPLLYTPDAFGHLPIHLAIRLGRNLKVVQKMIEYDIEHATLFPTSALQQSTVPHSVPNRTSMLLWRDRSGYLPIHYAVRKSASAVELLLEHELEAFRSCNISGDTAHHKPRSQLLYARTQKDETPLDHLCSGKSRIPFGIEFSWNIIQTLLYFENRWKDLDGAPPRPQLRRQSELLTPFVVDTLVEHWAQGWFEPKGLEYLLDRYELHPSVAIRPWLPAARQNIEEEWSDDSSTLLALEQEMSVLQRLEPLIPEGPLDKERTTRKYVRSHTLRRLFLKDFGKIV